MIINTKTCLKNGSENRLEQLLGRLEIATQRLEKALGAQSNNERSHEDTDGDGESVTLQEVLAPHIHEYLALSHELGGQVAQQSMHSAWHFVHYMRVVCVLYAAYTHIYVTGCSRYRVLDGLMFSGHALDAAAVSDAFLALECFMVDDSAPLHVLEGSLSQIVALRDTGRGTPVLNHLSMISEGAAALGWVMAGSTAAGYIQDMKDSAQFYADRRNATETAWVHSYMKLLAELLAYVKKYYPTGFVRTLVKLQAEQKNNDTTHTAGMTDSAMDVANVSDAIVTSSDASLPEIESPAPINIESVFAELNMGESITSKLRKVNKGEQVQKRVSPKPVSNVAGNPSSCSMVVEEKKTKMPCKKILIGNRWTIENFEGENIVIDSLETAQTVCIFGCKKSTIHLKGKANAVYMDQSTNCGLMIDTLISSIEFTRCSSLTFQVLGYTPTITLDQCSNCQVYLPLNHLNTEIITTKYDSINIHVPDTRCDGDYKEHSVPEMIRSTIVNGKLITNFIEHAG
ncbi:hypothetical protein PMAC_000575 [Pneumocystis sp. 'macacae']|nr:hypothetical protein PMAC_000575 [Pneumocystis sp. 'macacae']